MKFTMRKSALLGAFFAVSAVLPFSATAQSVDQVLGKQEQRTRLAQESQEKINNTVDQTRRLEGQYSALMKEVEGLEVYNTILERQVTAQEVQKTEYLESIDQVEVINRQIVPLMVKMIDSLEQFIELDVPFNIEERRERVTNLNVIMDRQDVTVAEKFRKVMEAYQIENDFGRTIESYKGTLDIDGGTKEVDFLRIGRISLVYQTADSKISGAWDQQSRQWISLGNEYRSAIRTALKIAKKQQAPDLVLLPVDAPEAS